MKILHLNTSDTGGAFQAAYRLHRSLRAQGLDSKMLVLYPHRSDLEEVYSFLDFCNFSDKLQLSVKTRLYNQKVKRLLKNKPSAQFSFPFSPYDLRKHPLVKEADIIHLHWVADFLDYATFFEGNSKPLLWTLHDANPFGGGFHQVEETLPAYQNLEQRVRQDKLAALAQGPNLEVVALCQQFYELSQKRLLEPFPHHLIPNGIDPEVFRPMNSQAARQALGLSVDKKLLLFIAHSAQEKRKGYADLAQAFSYLPDDFELLLLGSGFENQSQARIHALGFQSDPHCLVQAYSAADLLVVPSRDDNLPNTVLEAMACGRAVLGTKVGGIPDLIKSGFNGEIIPAAQPEQLAKAIQALFQHPEDLKKMGQKSRERALKDFTLARMTQEYQLLYESLGG